MKKILSSQFSEKHEPHLFVTENRELGTEN